MFITPVTETIHGQFKSYSLEVKDNMGGFMVLDCIDTHQANRVIGFLQREFEAELNEPREESADTSGFW